MRQTAAPSLWTRDLILFSREKIKRRQKDSVRMNSGVLVHWEQQVCTGQNTTTERRKGVARIASERGRGKEKHKEREREKNTR